MIMAVPTTTPGTVVMTVATTAARRSMSISGNNASPSWLSALAARVASGTTPVGVQPGEDDLHRAAGDQADAGAHEDADDARHRDDGDHVDAPDLDDAGGEQVGAPRPRR